MGRFTPEPGNQMPAFDTRGRLSGFVDGPALDWRRPRSVASLAQRSPHEGIEGMPRQPRRRRHHRDERDLL